MAKKMESSFKNMVIVLFSITFIASASMGLVNDLTKAAIEKSNEDLQKAAITNVMPKFDILGNNYAVSVKGLKDSVYVFPVYDSQNNLIGNAVKTHTMKGFGGLITLMVGIDKAGTVTGFQVLAHKETPGLGSKMGDWFSLKSKDSQYIIGKNPKKSKFAVKKDGGDVDAITAATISSRAFLDAVNNAFSALNTPVDGNSSATKKSN